MIDVSTLNDNGSGSDGLFGRAWAAIVRRDVAELDGYLALSPELAFEGGSEGMGAHDIFSRIVANHFQPLSRGRAKRAKSLFHHACERGSLDCARLLLREGARLNISCASGKRLTNPLLDLFLGVANLPPDQKKEAKTVAFARRLIAAGARFPHAENDAWDVAQSVASRGFFALAQVALDAAAFNAEDASSVDHAATTLSNAAAAGNLGLLRFFLAALPAAEIFRQTAQLHQTSVLARACSRNGGALVRDSDLVKCLDALMAAGESLKMLPATLSGELRSRSPSHAVAAEWIDLKRAKNEALCIQAALPASTGGGVSLEPSLAARRRL